MIVNNIYEGNCMDLFKELEDNSVDHVFTSPPYNRKRNDKYEFYDDVLVDYKSFLNGVITESMRVSRGYVFLNIQKNYYNKVEVFELIGDLAKYLVEILIWNKSNPMPASGKNITNAYEFILVFQKQSKSLKSNNTYTKNQLTTSVYSDNRYSKIHKALMHPDVCDYIITNFVKQREIVLDPFFGLGTTAIGCIKNNVNFIGFELSSKYIDVAKERIADV